MFRLLLSYLQALQDTDPSNLDLSLGGPEDDSIGVETCSPIPMLMDTIDKLLC